VKTTNKFQNISVKGFITIKDQYTLPTVDGVFGHIMITDGAGGVTFQAPSALSLTTNDITEDPSNLYFTNERVDDRVDQLIIDGTGLTWTYLDGADTLQGNVVLTPFTTTDLSEGTNQYYTGERVDDRVSTLLQNGTGISWLYSDNGTSAGTLTPTITLSPFDTDDLSEGAVNKYATNENIDDRVSNLILDGTGLTWTYNNPANTFTGNVSLSSFDTDDLSEGAINKYYLDESVADYLGNTLLQDTATVTWTYNDIANTLEADAVSQPLLIDIQKGGGLIGSRGIINFIEGAGVALSIADNGANSRVDVTVTSTSTGNAGTLNKILSENLQIGDADIESLNFSSKFSVVEAPDTYVTVDITMLIEELSDVSMISPAINGDILLYNGTSGLWENESIVELLTLDNLSNVELTSPILNGQIITFNNGTGLWTNSDRSLYTLDEVETSMSPISGDIMRYNTSSSKWEAARPFTIISRNGTQTGGLYPEELDFSTKFSTTVNGGNPARIDVDIIMTLDELTNVTVSAPSNGEIIKYNSGSGQWENAADGSSVMLQDVYDNSTLGRITTDVTRGSFEIKQGSGSNTDIILEGINDVDATVFSLTGEGKITAGEWNGTEIGILYGGTGQTTAQAAIDALTQVSSGTTSHVLTKDGSGNATWQATAAADLTIIQVDGVQVSTGAPTLDFDSTYFSLTESPTDDFDITFLPGGIDHDSLLNFVTNEHIDHTNVTITAGSGLSYSVFGTDISQDSTIELDINSLTTESVIAGTDFIAFWDVIGVTNKKITVNNFLTGLSLGLTQVLSADNTTSGRDIIITAGDNIIFESGSFGSTIGTETLTADWVANLPNASGTLALTSQTNGTIGHDTDLTGVVSDEHIDHTQVTLTAGIGLTGGGTIAANRTFDLDIPGLTALSSPFEPVSADTFAIYNSVSAAHEELTLTQLANGVQTELSLVDGSGTNNYISKWTPDGNTLGDSLIQDDGTTLGIGIAPNASYYLHLSSSIRTGVFNETFYNGALTSWGLQVSNSGVDTATNKFGIQTSVGNNPTLNTGIYSRAYSAAITNVGIFAEAVAATNNYAIRLVDGTETTANRVLSNIDTSGHAHWVDLTESMITDLGSYALETTTITAGIGLVGGGDISANRTIDLNIPELPALSEGSIASADTFAMYNASVPAHEEVTLTQIAAGIQTELGLVTGAAVNNQVAVWSGTDTLDGDSGFTFDGTTLVVPNLTVSGTTTTIDSTVVTIADPVFQIGDDAVDDNKDRGISFLWNNGATKEGFFGLDDSTGRFTFIPDATNTTEVFSGTLGDVEFGGIYGTIQTVSQTNITEIGTITTGTWNGTAIGDTYISSAATWNALVSNVTTNLSEGVTTNTTVDVDSSDGTNATLAAASTIRAGVMTKAKFDEVVANNAKISNVSTDLSLGPISATAMDVNSSDGTNVTLTEADTNFAGVMSAAKWNEIVANTLKNTNVSTTLSQGTLTATTYGITSDGGADDIVLIEADTNNAGLLGSDKWDEIVANTLKNTNVSTTLAAGTITGTTYGITSDGGADDIILPQATITEAGLLAAADQVKLNNTSGTNTGDQTSIVGITGTKAQFDTELSDGNFMYIGDAPTAHTHLLAAGATDVTATAAEVNLLDLAALTARDVLVASGATAASWRPLVEADISDLGTGSTMNADTTLAGNAYFLDDDTMAGNDATKVASQQSIVAYVSSEIASAITTGMDYKGAYNASTNTPDLDTSPIAANIGDVYAVTVAGTFFTVLVEAGDILIANQNTPTVEAHWDVVQANLTPASIKTQYESNADTNAFTDAEQTSIGHISVTQAVNLDTMESDIALNNAKVTNVSTDLSLGTLSATTMIVNSSDGTNATLIEADTTNAGLLGSDKWDEIVANTLKNTNISTSLSTGTVTSTTYAITSDGGADDVVLVEATTSSAGLLGSDKWDEIVANTAKVSNITQTSIVGITGTKAQFNTELSDGTFMYVGDAPTAHTHLLAAGATDITATAAEVNILDLAGLTTGWTLRATGATTAAWGQLRGGDINNDQGWTSNAGTVTSIATTEGISGGSITSSGTLRLDFTGLADLSEAVVAADTIAIFNASASAHQEATFTQVQAYMQANLSFGGGGAPSLRNVTATTTFSTAHETINCLSGTFTVNLPAANPIQGTTYTIVNSGTGVITLDGNGSETINGAETITLVEYESRTVQSTGSGSWIII